MKRTKIPWIILCLAQIAFLCGSGRAREIEEASKPAGKSSFVVLPIVFYTPETKFAGGIGGLFAFRPRSAKASDRPSSISFYAIITQLKQFRTNWEPSLYLSHEKYLISGKLTLERFPGKYWGIGNGTADSAEEDFRPRMISLEAAFQTKLFPKKPLYAGLTFVLENFKVMKTAPDQALASGKIPGSSGGTILGAGFILSWDSRDNVFFPRRGDYWQLTTYFNGKTLGGDFSYTSAKLNIRHYIPLFRSHVLAFQGILQLARGNPPFNRYAALGGDMMMRGYYTGRFRDRALVAAQAEYRMPVWWRFGLVGFAGVGDVAPNLGAFRFGYLKSSMGFGIRFKIVPREGANLRVDFAWGKNTSGVYFTAGEAF